MNELIEQLEELNRRWMNEDINADEYAYEVMSITSALSLKNKEN